MSAAAVDDKQDIALQLATYLVRFRMTGLEDHKHLFDKKHWEKVNAKGEHGFRGYVRSPGMMDCHWRGHGAFSICQDGTAFVVLDAPCVVVTVLGQFLKKLELADVKRIDETIHHNYTFYPTTIYDIETIRKAFKDSSPNGATIWSDPIDPFCSIGICEEEVENDAKRIWVGIYGALHNADAIKLWKQHKHLAVSCIT